MKLRPILFSAPMVRALLREVDPKTQTRRIVKPQPWGPVANVDLGRDLERFHWHRKGQAWPPVEGTHYFGMRPETQDELVRRCCPYGKPGDRLWVRETHAPGYFDGGRAAYRADWTGESGDLVKEPRWKPSIFMRPADSRITLEVTAVRVERLQDITTDDVIAEGVAVPAVDYNVPEDPRQLDAERGEEARRLFAKLWDSINGERAPWKANPWVFVIGFRRIKS